MKDEHFAMLPRFTLAQFLAWIGFHVGDRWHDGSVPLVVSRLIEEFLEDMEKAESELR